MVRGRKIFSFFSKKRALNRGLNTRDSQSEFFPQEIPFHFLKSDITNAKRCTESKPPQLHIAEFPGSDGRSFIVCLTADFKLNHKGPCGFQIISKKSEHKHFLYFNLLTEDEIPRYAGLRARFLFTFSVPAHFCDFDLLFTNGYDDLETVCTISLKEKRCRFTSAPEYQLHDKASSSTFSYLFVGGPPKSGSTWIEKILNAHPDILCSGEGNLFINPVEGKITNYNFWFPPTAEPESYANIYRIAAADFLFRTYHSIWPTAYVADRSPAYTYSGDSALRAFPNARYVHCSRHPLDVAVSRLFHQANLRKTGSDPEEHIALTDPEKDWVDFYTAQHSVLKKGAAFAAHWDILRKILDEWVHAEILHERLALAYPGQVHVVRYEEMLNNFAEESARLFNFLGVSVDGALLSAIQQATHFSTLSGGRGSGEEDASSFFRKGVAQDYLNHFTDEQVERAMQYIDMRLNWSRNN